MVCVNYKCGNQAKGRMNSLTSQQNDIAVIGMSCRLGTTKSPNEFWNALLHGESFFREIPQSRFNYNEYYDPELSGYMYTKYGSFIDNIDQFDCRLFEMSPTEAELVDPQHRLLLQLTWEALENGGIPPDSLKGSKTGTFVGTCSHDHDETVVLPVSKDGAYFSTANINSAASGRISHFLKVHGPSMSIDTACSSSLVALHFALQSLHRRECKIAIVGGVQTLLSPRTYTNYCRAKMLSPNLQCRPFDIDADGFVRGEGCTVLILKKLDDTLADGDIISGIIKGSVINQDGIGTGGGIAVPNGRAQETLINLALEKCSLTPNDIDYIETHGTGTPVGDPIELNALEAVFNRHNRKSRPLIIGSVKANIGHLEGAAGLTGILKALLALRARIVPPQINFTQIHPKVNNPDFFRIPKQMEPMRIGQKLRVGISSFGVSGTNAHVIIEEAPTSYLEQPKPTTPSSINLITISANSKESLQNLLEKYENLITVQQQKENPRLDYLRNMAYTTNIGRMHFQKYRAAFVTNSANDLLQKMKSNSGFYSSNSNTNKRDICFLFTGQGSQYFGMAKNLYNTNHTFAMFINDCDRIIQELYNKSLVEILYENNTLLEDDRYSQLAIFSIEYALASFWIKLGLKPTFLIGHSIGEYVIAAIIGLFTLKDALEIIITRANLIHELVICRPQDYGMLAVNENLQSTKNILRNIGLDKLVEISCKNHPSQTVVSGPKYALERFQKIAIACHSTLLNVPYAFHSTQLKPIVDNFKKLLEKINFNVKGDGMIKTAKIISTCTGKEISRKEMCTVSYWIKQSLDAVDFLGAINTVKSLTKNELIFVEIGAKPVLCNLAKNCLKDGQADGGSSYSLLPTIQEDESNRKTLLSTIGQLYVEGHDFKFALLYNSHNYQKIELPLYPFENSSYWSKQCTTIDINGTSNWAPLVGQLKCCTQTELIFENFALEPFGRLNYLSDCVFQGELIFPNIGFVEIICQAAKLAFLTNEVIELSEMYIRHPLVMSKIRAVHLQTILTFNKNLNTTFEVFTKERNNVYNLHSNGVINNSVSNQAHPIMEFIDLETFKSTYNPIKLFRFYECFEKNKDVKFSSRFKATKKLWIRKKEALSKIVLDQNATCGYIYHPILLENAFQTFCSILLLNEEYEIKNYLVLFSIHQIQVNLKNYCEEEGRMTYFVHARIKEEQKDKLIGNIYITDQQGKILIALNELTCLANTVN